MRMMLRALMDTQVSNKTLESGEMQKLIDSLIDDLKPEAAYFSPHCGRRACVMVFDMQDSAQLPSIAERLFRTTGAEVEIQPVMNRDDLQRGLAALA
jgi:hypothetical protein